MNTNYPMQTPIGTIYPENWQIAPYVTLNDEQLEAEIKKPFIDPFAFAVYQKRKHLI